jgi:hypothetical protein
MTAAQLNTRSGVDDALVKEVVRLQEKTALCKKMLNRHNTFDPKKFKCPVWQGHRRGGMRPYDATCLLRERIDSGLHNLAQQITRGEALLNVREDHYWNVSNTDTILEVEDMEWSDDEKDYNPNVQDDIAHPKKYRPSTRWLKRHHELEDSNSNWNSEVNQAEVTKGYAEAEGGKFNSMDGRYHNNQKDAIALAKHLERTVGRKVCEFYTTKDWCKYGFDCTNRHAPYDEFAYQNFDSRAYQHEQPVKGKNKGKGKGKGKGKKGKRTSSNYWPDRRSHTW